MKYLMIALAVLALLLGGAWFGGEALLAGALRDRLTADAPLAAQSVQPLRSAGRFGLRLGPIEMSDEGQTLTAPGLVVYTSLSAPDRLTVDVPESLRIEAPERTVDLGFGGGQVHAAVSPLRGMALREVGVAADGMTVDGAPLFQTLQATATLSHMGGGAPAGSQASYALTLLLDGLHLRNVAETLRVEGPGQIWLDRLPDRSLAQQEGPPPALTGAQTPGLRITLGDDATARIIGRIEADSDGFASGQAALYTAHAQAFIDLAVQTGMIPPQSAVLVRTLLIGLSDTHAELTEASAAEAAGTTAGTPAATPASPATLPRDPLPPPAEGEIRLLLTLSDGQMRLGPVPIGAAPRLRP